LTTDTSPLPPSAPLGVRRFLARPWLLAFVPVSAATSGFGVALPLLILIPLHGAWTDVALAAALYNGAAILASIAWGRVADRFAVRRTLLLLTYGGFGVAYLALANVHSIPALLVLYTFTGLVAPAGGNAASLLLLERFGNGERPLAIASYNWMNILGAIAGLLAGYGWLAAGYPLSPLLYVLAALVFASFAWVWIGVRDLPRSRGPGPLHTPMIQRFHIPELSLAAWGRLRQWAGGGSHRALAWVLAATFLFNLTANLYNISYTPYLYSVGVGAAAIFLVNLSNSLAQGLVYPFSGTWTNREGAGRVVRRSTGLRAGGYLATAALTLVPLTAAAAFFSNAWIYAVLGAAVAFYATSSSVLTYQALERHEAGLMLGLAGALGGIAAIAGAALSGLFSVYGSYRLAFLVSGVGLLLSVPLWNWATAAVDRTRTTGASIPP
jgi:MFS family permease